MNIRYCLLLAMPLFGACARPHETLVVKQFQLRDQAQSATDEPMTKMEKERRLYGAVTMAERRNRLGQYYSLYWNDAAGANQAPVELIFEYQQGATASLVKRTSQTFPASDTSGTAEFSIIGDNYFNNGKILAWKATLLRGKRTIATRQSYLWR